MVGTIVCRNTGCVLRSKRLGLIYRFGSVRPQPFVPTTRAATLHFVQPLPKPWIARSPYLFSTSRYCGSLASSEKNLYRQTRQWLRSKATKPTYAWTLKDSNVARSLLEQWMLPGDGNHNLAEKALAVSKIYRTWFASTSFAADTQKDYSIFVEYLNWILNVWKQAVAGGPTHSSKPNQALNMFQLTLETAQATQNNSLLPKDKTFSSMFDVMALSPSLEILNQARTLLAVRLDMTNIPPPDLTFWNSFINVLAKHSSLETTIVDEAEQVLEALAEQADERTVASVLEAWVHSNRVKEAGARCQGHLNVMLRVGKLNAVCFALTIKAWSVSGHPQKAESCLRHMLHLHQQDPKILALDANTFLPVIQAYGNAGDVDKVAHLLNMMQALQEETGNSALQLTSRVFLALLQAWSKRKNAGEEVEKILQTSIQNELQHSGVGCDCLSPQAFTVAIKAWAKSDNPQAPERAEALLAEIKRLHKAGFNHIQMTHHHFSAAISVWASSEREEAPDRAIRLLRQCHDEVGADGVVYNAVLSVLARHGMAHESEEILAEMNSLQDGSAIPNCVSYTNVVRAYVESRHERAGERALEILQEWESMFDDKNNSHRPNQALYLAVATAQSLTSEEEAEHVLWEMVRRYETNEQWVPPSTRICNKVMEIWLHSDFGRAPEKVEDIFRWMVNDGCQGLVRPDDRSYLLAINAWARSGRRVAASRIDAILDILGRDGCAEARRSVLHALPRVLENSLGALETQRFLEKHANM